MNRTGFSPLCCMRADCSDKRCPGVQIARLFQADGGHAVDNSNTAPLEMPARQPMPRAVRLLWLRFLLILLVAVVAAAAQVFF